MSIFENISICPADLRGFRHYQQHNDIVGMYISTYYENAYKIMEQLSESCKQRLLEMLLNNQNPMKDFTIRYELFQISGSYIWF